MIKSAGDQELIVQQYIEKKNEFCLDGMSINGGRDVFISMASTYTYLLPESYSFRFRIRNYTNIHLIDRIKDMLSSIGFEGIFSVEFLIGRDGKFYFMEFNFRNSAWSYASTRLGMNLVTGWAFDMLNHEFPQNLYKKIPAGYIAMVELPDFRNRVLMGRIGIVRWFRELKSTDCLFYYNKKDIKPFYSAILTSLLRKGVQQ